MRVHRTSLWVSFLCFLFCTGAAAQTLAPEQPADLAMEGLRQRYQALDLVSPLVGRAPEGEVFPREAENLIQAILLLEGGTPVSNLAEILGLDGFPSAPGEGPLDPAGDVDLLFEALLQAAPADPLKLDYFLLAFLDGLRFRLERSSGESLDSEAARAYFLEHLTAAGEKLSSGATATVGGTVLAREQYANLLLTIYSSTVDLFPDPADFLRRFAPLVHWSHADGYPRAVSGVIAKLLELEATAGSDDPQTYRKLRNYRVALEREVAVALERRRLSPARLAELFASLDHLSALLLRPVPELVAPELLAAPDAGAQWIAMLDEHLFFLRRLTALLRQSQRPEIADAPVPQSALTRAMVGHALAERLRAEEGAIRAAAEHRWKALLPNELAPYLTAVLAELCPGAPCAEETRRLEREADEGLNLEAALYRLERELFGDRRLGGGEHLVQRLELYRLYSFTVEALRYFLDQASLEERLFEQRTGVNEEARSALRDERAKAYRALTRALPAALVLRAAGGNPPPGATPGNSEIFRHQLEPTVLRSLFDEQVTEKGIVVLGENEVDLEIPPGIYLAEEETKVFARRITFHPLAAIRVLDGKTLTLLADEVSGAWIDAGGSHAPRHPPASGVGRLQIQEGSPPTTRHVRDNDVKGFQPPRQPSFSFAFSDHEPARQGGRAGRIRLLIAGPSSTPALLVAAGGDGQSGARGADSPSCRRSAETGQLQAEPTLLTHYSRETFDREKDIPHRSWCESYKVIYRSVGREGDSERRLFDEAKCWKAAKRSHVAPAKPGGVGGAGGDGGEIERVFLERRGARDKALLPSDVLLLAGGRPGAGGAAAACGVGGDAGASGAAGADGALREGV